VLSGLFPILYAAALTFLMLQAFRMMSMASTTDSRTIKKRNDRTGLQTVHPELLDADGNLTDEDLWVVRFSDQEGFAPSQS